MPFRSFVAGAVLLAGGAALAACTQTAVALPDGGGPQAEGGAPLDASTQGDATDTGTPADGGTDAGPADADGGPSTTQWVGRVDDGTDGGTYVALVVTGDRTLLFFCSSGATLSTLTHWMRSTTPGTTSGQPFALSDTDGTASATGSVGGSQASGTLTVGDAASLPWSAGLVAADAGVVGLWDGLVADAGSADLIVLDPNDALGAFKQTTINQVLQVTPLKSPVSLTGTGVEVQVTINGVTQTALLERGTAD